MSLETTPLRVLVVDDSSLYRKVVRTVLADMPGVEVVGTAHDGPTALKKIEQLKPDMVTLDIEMPGLTGFEVLRELAARHSSVMAIVIGALSQQGVQSTTTALQLGALDFVIKPSASSLEENIAILRADLVPRVELCRERRAIPYASQFCAVSRLTSSQVAPRKRLLGPPEIIAIGISTGGPPTLLKLLPQLPGALPCPVVIVQHMPPLFTRSLAEDLDRCCAIAVHEAEQGQVVEAGHVYIAPGGKQMRLERRDNATVVAITDDPAEHFCKPSVNYLFRSIAEIYGRTALAMILTGMGNDGTEGCRILRKAGAHIVAQDEQSCVVYGMPRSVVEAGLADEVQSLDEIIHQLVSLAERKVRV